MERLLGVIPARAGSKGIPRKNIASLKGRPLIAHTIAAAKGSKALPDFLVSTDSEEIAWIACAEGARVPFLRPAELATDEASTLVVLKHAVEFYEIEAGALVHSVVTLQPTSPLRTALDIDDAIRWYLENQPAADSLISVCCASYMHPLTLYKVDGAYLDPFLPGKNPTTRRQEFQKIFWRNGAIYIARRDLLFQKNRVVSEHPLYYEMPRSRSVCIDDSFDLKLAELLSDYHDDLGEAEQ